MQGPCDLGQLNFTSSKWEEIRDMVVRAPSAIRLSYAEKKIKKSFTRPGWSDEETQQGPDLLMLFKTLKRARTSDERERWERDLPRLVKEIL